MSQVSEAVQAKRKARRDASFNSQDNQSAADFDFNLHGEGHIGNGEVRHLRKQGHSRDDIMSAAQNSGEKIGNRAQKRFDKWGEAKERAQINKPAVEPSNDEDDMVYAGGSPGFYDKGGPGNGASPTVGMGSNPNNTPKTSGDARHQSMNQNANQDNDATSTITGDNNTVRIDQDNSVRQYGGINKSFTYNGGNGNNYQDAPVSMGTMAGYFYDEDTPAKSAAFVDRYTTMNDDYQKKYKNSSTAQDAINAASRNEAIDLRALDQKINDR